MVGPVLGSRKILAGLEVVPFAGRGTHVRRADASYGHVSAADQGVLSTDRPRATCGTSCLHSYRCNDSRIPAWRGRTKRGLSEAA
jgi:hypothetical protein